MIDCNFLEPSQPAAHTANSDIFTPNLSDSIQLAWSSKAFRIEEQQSSSQSNFFALYVSDETAALFQLRFVIPLVVGNP